MLFRSCSLIFWGASDPAKSITYTDSLFLVVSAMTEAGLNTVNLSQMTTFQQFLLWLLILIGSSIFVSIGTILTRKRVFESRFKHVVKMQKEARRTHRRSMSESRDLPASQRLAGQKKMVDPEHYSEFESRHSQPRDPASGTLANPMTQKVSGHSVGEGRKEDSTKSTVSGNREGVNESAVDEDARIGNPDHIGFMRYAPAPDSEQMPQSRVLSFVGVGAHPNSTSYRPPYAAGATLTNLAKKEAHHLSHRVGLDLLLYPDYVTRHTTGRNAQFYGLSKAEREHLGGVEYRAITLLAYIVPIYFVLWQLLGCLGLAAYMGHYKASTARENGINPW